ncbi:MAG: AAA family ATPase [Cyclobacteriaceae bacterium]|nr:AAA family ATPase [Cyclobacteriaceae bacterium]
MPQPSHLLKQRFAFEPTAGQLKLFDLMDDFLNPDHPSEILVLKGYAGTGKTSLIPALVQVLPLFNFKYLLMAPTGRAAKVMSGYTKRSAFTIHKIIFKQTADPSSGLLKFSRLKNYNKHTVFVVDEASMLSEDDNFGQAGVLSQLMTFVFEHPTNRLILIGDTAQLPPVGQDKSPALDRQFIENKFKRPALEVELTEVMRQQQNSGILINATNLRAQLKTNTVNIQLETKQFKDVYRMTGEKLEDGLRYSYDKYGPENTMVVCRSNKSALLFNNHIRMGLLYRQEEVEAGDHLMVVRNNYHYVPDDSPSGFLANGDYVWVKKIINNEEMYGFRFATLEFQLVDLPDAEPFEAKVILDTLHTHTPALTPEQNKELYAAVKDDYQDITNKKLLNEKLREDPYLNALQIKYAYAVTCHKSQGGQWKSVFVDQGYITEEQINKEYIRWLYTAVTRASSELFLVNFNQKLFKN